MAFGLALIHPLGELVVWEPVIQLLVAERDVIALDMPGFGASPPLPDDAAPTPQALAVAIGRFMDALGMERPHMVGNSLGGWVALELRSWPARMGGGRLERATSCL